ncbi:hypothetical protein LCGC14_1763310 [marine sediment metagenome]|uniref:Uncharacterized protein n=1 Tax=marine sediment metagenome TaxID=412755 RepID=A0A0F9HMU4_9ZZZZ
MDGNCLLVSIILCYLKRGFRMKLPKCLIVEWMPSLNKYKIHTSFEFAGQKFYPGELIGIEFLEELKRRIE